MDGRCAKHQFEAAESSCRACGNEFCGECLVYSFGPKKPPFCIACALTAAGVRTTAANRPVKPKKELKKETRARRKEARASLRNRTANVEIEWSMAEDPTEGLTEEDLLLPTTPADTSDPPSPPSLPLTAPDPTEPARPIGPNDLVGTFEPTAPLSQEEPPQFLLHPDDATDTLASEVPPPAAGAGPTLDRPDGLEPAFADLTALLPEPLPTAPTGPTFAADGPGFATDDRDGTAALADLAAITQGSEREPRPPADDIDPAPAFNVADLTPEPTPPHTTPPPAPRTSPDPAPAFNVADLTPEPTPPHITPPISADPSATVGERPAAPTAPRLPETARAPAPPPRRPMFASPPPGPADVRDRSSTSAPLAPRLAPPGTRTAPPEPDPSGVAADPRPPAPPSRRPLGQATRAPGHGHGAKPGPRVDTGRSAPPPPPDLTDIAGPAHPAGVTPSTPPAADVPPVPVRVDADHLFTADTPPAPPPPAPALGADSPWDHVVGRHPLRVRDLLDDPDDSDHPADPQPTTRASRRAAEPSFFAPVTPEQLGDDPWPPAR